MLHLHLAAVKAPQPQADVGLSAFLIYTPDWP